MKFRLNVKLVSVLLGFIVWIYVNLVVSPMVRRTVIVPVDYKNLPPLMRVTPKEAEAEIILTGTRRDFIFAGPQSAQALVDLYSLRPGPAMMPLEVTTPSGLSVVSVKPSQMLVTGEALVRKEFEVSVEMRGQTAEGFIAESPRVSPKRVVVEAPPEVMRRISTCQVPVVVDDMKNSISEARLVQVFAETGEVVEDVRVLPDRVKLDVTVKEGYPTRVVPVASPTFLNKPPEGLRLEGFSVSPEMITISGPARVLERVSRVDPLPVNLATLQGHATVTALIRSPFESVKILGSNTVRVSIQLGRARVVRSMTGVPLRLKRSDRQHGVVSVSSYSIVLEGYTDDLEAISPADLAQELDVRSMAPGSHTIVLACPVKVPENVVIREIRPAGVQVLVAEIPPPEATASQELPAASASSPLPDH